MDKYSSQVSYWVVSLLTAAGALTLNLSKGMTVTVYIPRAAAGRESDLARRLTL